MGVGLRGIGFVLVVLVGAFLFGVNGNGVFTDYGGMGEFGRTFRVGPSSKKALIVQTSLLPFFSNRFIMIPRLPAWDSALDKDADGERRHVFTVTLINNGFDALVYRVDSPPSACWKGDWEFDLIATFRNLPTFGWLTEVGHNKMTATNRLKSIGAAEAPVWYSTASLKHLHLAEDPHIFAIARTMTPNFEGAFVVTIDTPVTNTEVRFRVQRVDLDGANSCQPEIPDDAVNVHVDWLAIPKEDFRSSEWDSENKQLGSRYDSLPNKEASKTYTIQFPRTFSEVPEVMVQIGADGGPRGANFAATVARTRTDSVDVNVMRVDPYPSADRDEEDGTSKNFVIFWTAEKPTVDRQSEFATRY